MNEAWPVSSIAGIGIGIGAVGLALVIGLGKAITKLF
jgi:hypothetical protein